MAFKLTKTTGKLRVQFNIDVRSGWSFFACIIRGKKVNCFYGMLEKSFVKCILLNKIISYKEFSLCKVFSSKFPATYELTLKKTD